MTENDNTAAALPEMRLELTPAPVSHVDRARAFYRPVGFVLRGALGNAPRTTCPGAD